MTKAIIYKPTKNAMQSGTGGRATKWLLEYTTAQNPHFVDPLMGWTGGNDTTRQIRLSFDTMEAAVKYAESRHILFEVLHPKTRKSAPKSYADNFKHSKAH